MVRLHPKRMSGEISMPDAQMDDTQQYIRQFLQEHNALLLGIIRSYIVHMGLAHGDAVQGIAMEVLQETVIEALTHAHRFDPTTQPRAWCLAIAANILKRRKVAVAKHQQREVTISELFINIDEPNESDFFDSIAASAYPGPEHDLEAPEHVQEMLSLLAQTDQEIICLALLHDLDANSLAQVLGVTPGTARVRLHRALNRLRTAWAAHQREEQKRGDSHA